MGRLQFTKRQIAECNEVVVAKLARTDYPNLWYLSRKFKQIFDRSIETVIGPHS
jgi:hypothetical protein